jgi:hypothetical protein
VETLLLGTARVKRSLMASTTRYGADGGKAGGGDEGNGGGDGGVGDNGGETGGGSSGVGGCNGGCGGTAGGSMGGAASADTQILVTTGYTQGYAKNPIRTLTVETKTRRTSQQRLGVDDVASSPFTSSSTGCAVVPTCSVSTQSK